MDTETTEESIQTEEPEQEERETVTLDDLTEDGKTAEDGGQEPEGEKGQGGEKGKTEPGAKEIAALLIDIAGPEMARKFAQDKATQDAIAAGADPVKAFRKFRERLETGESKRGIPTTRQQSAGTTSRKSSAAMSEAEFAAFDQKVQRALASGKRVRL